MIRLLIARHGNNFAPGDKVVTAGSRNDLPLVDRGWEQAASLGQALMRTNRLPSLAFAGPLQRHHHFAAKALEVAGVELAVQQDARLNEIDFGGWTGLSDAEIQERFGAEAFAAWHHSSQFPPPPQWGETEAAVVARVDDFCQTLTRALQANPPGGCALVVSSNGVLRFMLRLVDGLFDSRNATQAVRMKTGHVSEFLLDEQGWRLNFWDQNPNDLS